MTPTNDTSHSEDRDAAGHPAVNGPLPAFVDWLLSALVAAGGLLSLAGGAALVFVVDRAFLAEGIEEGTITVTAFTAELTEAEMLDVTDAVVSWAGVGLLLTGVGMLLFAAGYVVSRHRARRRAERDDEPLRSYGAHAVLGAVATGVLSFLPFAPGVGGALAGYLERGDSDRTVSVGALAGLLAVAPALSVLVFVLGGLVTGLRAVEQGGMAILSGVTVLFAVLLVATIGAGLGALGGYVGGRLAESRAHPD